MFGVNVATGTWLVQPICVKTDPTIDAALKRLRGPRENRAKLFIRSDQANGLVKGVESVGFADPIATCRPISNNAEREILTYSDLLRIHMIRSGFSPAFRPLVSIAVAQLQNLLRTKKRLDVDGNDVFRSPYQIRHGDKSVEVALDKCPMPGQLLTYVPLKTHQVAQDRIEARGVDYVFCCFDESHGIIYTAA